MRIRELRVNRYGPLSDISLTDIGDFTLIFGENESGKTLLLDAMLRFILRNERDRCLFPRLDRVEYDPDGFIDISLNGDVVRFPEKGSLPELLNVHAEDLRNVVVVRSSDLQVHESKDKEYYSEITDRLLGIHRKPIQRIYNKLHVLGRLTGTGKLSDSKDSDKVGSRVNAAKILLGKIDNHKKALAETDMVVLESEFLEKKDICSDLSKQLELLEEAENRDKYESGERMRVELGACLADIKELPIVDQKIYDRWRDAVNSINDSAKKIEEEKIILNRREETLETKHDDLEKFRDQIREFQRKKTGIVEIRKSTENYCDDFKAGVGRRPIRDLLPWGSVVMSVLLAISLVGLILDTQSGFFKNASLIIGVLFVITISALLAARLNEGRRNRAWENLRLKAIEQGIKAERFEDLLAAIVNFEGEFEQTQIRLMNAETAQKVAASQVESQAERIEELHGRIEQVGQILTELKESTGLMTFEALQQTMKEHKELGQQRQDLLTRLAERFGENEGSVEAKLEDWRIRIGELAYFEGAAPGVEYDESEKITLKSEIESLNTKTERLEEQLRKIREDFSDIAAEANLILTSDELLPCDTFEDLGVIEREISSFVRDIEIRAHLAGTAIQILEDIQAQEEEKVKGLFGDDDLATMYFRSITSGAYKGVEYEPSDGELKVVRADGEKIRAYVLSAGTYDQLYLATRLSLAHKILQGKRGFLLLDDPFLTSDNKRLARQLNLLLSLAGDGWQIIYFSVKDEVKAGLRKAIKARSVVYVELNPIHG